MWLIASSAMASETVRVGVHEAPPFVTVTGDRPHGFAIDVLDSIAAQNDWHIEFVHGTWDQQLERLGAGQIDLLVPVSRNHQRQSNLEFGSEPLLSTWGQVFGPEDAGAQTLLALDGKRIAVVRDDAFGAELAALLREFAVDFELVRTDSTADAFSAVAAGTADVAAVERIDGSARIEEFGLAPTAVIFHPTAARFAAPEGAREHLAAIDVALAQQKQDPHSAYRRAFDRWLGTGSTRAALPKWVVPVLVGFAGALVLALMFAVALRVRVKAATKELRERNLQLRREAKQRAAIQDQLREAQKMEAVGQLAAGVAHDFNNLLTVIQSYSELLEDDLAQERGLAASAIRDAATEAGGLTRQLLAFARRQTLQMEVVGVNALLDDAAPLLRGALREDIRLTLDLSTDVPDVSVDPAQLRQVLLNLVVNARDAMPTGGSITISTRAQERQAQPHAQIRVRDSGEGMDETTRRRVFEPFFTTKRTMGGTGLGLSVALGIVEQSGGRLELRSEPGQGTTVNIWLPATQRSGSHRRTASPGAANLGAIRVLLVDDDAAVRRSVRDALRSRGLTVVTASSGEDALNLVTSGDEFDVIVTDVVMPSMRGPELSERLHSAGVRTPVLLTSGYAASDLGEVGTIEGGVDYLQKPFRVDQLVARIAEILARAPDPSSEAGSGVLRAPAGRTLGP